MIRHLKRQAVPKSWPVPRKGTTFVVKPNANLEKGIPVLIAVRDLLKIAKNRKEVKKAINAKNILVNGKVPKDERNSVSLFDVLTIVPSKENYKITLKENGKFNAEKISDKDAGHKISKVIGKKVLKGKKIQLNLSDGRNVLFDKDCKINDSVLFDFSKKKIEKIIPLKEKSSVIVFAGKHAGKKGTIEKVKAERKMASIKTKENKINVLIKQFMVVE